MIVLRPLVRLVGVLWLLALALVGLGVALYCFDGLVSLGSARPDRLVDLMSVRRSVGRLLDQLAAPGSLAGLSLLCGVVAILVGGLLAVGVLRHPRERLVLLELDAQAGTLGARRGALRDMVRARVARVRGATNVKRPKLRPARRGTGGRLTLEVAHARGADPRELEGAAAEALRAITEPFGLKPRVQARLGERGDRVQ